MANEIVQVMQRAVRMRRPPQGVRGWAHKIFLEDGWLKLLALIISFALWFGVTANRTPATFIVPNVMLNFRVASNLTISNELRQNIEVTLSGDKTTLNRINPTELVAYVDVSDLPAGEHVFAMKNGERLTIGLPDGVTVSDIQPGEITLKLEPRIERDLAINVRHTGKLPEGYELTGIRVTPIMVKVRGAESRVKALRQAQTDEVSLDGHKQDFTIPQLAINISDKRVDLIDTSVRADFSVSEIGGEKTLYGVFVRAASGANVAPDRTDIIVYAPRSLMNQLKSEDVRVLLKPNADGKLEAQLEILRTDAQGKITLRSVQTDLKNFYILPQ